MFYFIDLLDNADQIKLWLFFSFTVTISTSQSYCMIPISISYRYEFIPTLNFNIMITNTLCMMYNVGQKVPDFGELL